MEIITLVENSTSDPRLKEEFGLSLLIKCSGGSILFDMGASSRFAENASILGEDLSSVDCAVVSHAHYDHGGGLLKFIDINSSAVIYVGSNFDGKYFGNAGARIPPILQPVIYPLVKNSLMLSRYIGIDRKVFDDHADRLISVGGRQEILKDVYLLTNLISKMPPAEGNKFLLEKRGSKLHKDSFAHEIFMVIREGDGLVIFTGCGHNHILNMLETVEQEFAGERIKGVVGGFHLALQPGRPGMAGKKEDVQLIGAKFLAAKVGRVLTGHCTGQEACSIFEEMMGNKYSPLSTGYCCTL